MRPCISSLSKRQCLVPWLHTKSTSGLIGRTIVIWEMGGQGVPIHPPSTCHLMMDIAAGWGSLLLGVSSPSSDLLTTGRRCASQSHALYCQKGLSSMSDLSSSEQRVAQRDPALSREPSLPLTQAEGISVPLL